MTLSKIMENFKLPKYVEPVIKMSVRQEFEDLSFRIGDLSS